MSSKKSYSKNKLISVPLITENLKRFWLGSVMAFIGYFLSVCLPILTLRDAYQINSILTGSYFLVAFWAAGVPVVAALLIFRYLHQQSSAAIVHAMPLSRRQLYYSNVLSGIILCLVPVLVISLFLLGMRILGGPVAPPDDPSLGFAGRDVFTYGQIFRFIGGLVTMNLIVFAISSLAAVLVGTALMQALFSGILLVVFSGLILIFSGFGSMFLFGYTMPETVSRLALYLCPVAGLLANRSGPVLLGYLVAAAVICLIAGVLYKRRKLERATDTLTFDFSKPIVKYILTFCGMSAMGFLFQFFSEGKAEIPLFFLGCGLGALLTYVSVEMTIQKRFRIKGFVKGFGLFVIGAVVLFAGYQFDFSGYEKRVPEASEVEGLRPELVDFLLDDGAYWEEGSENAWIRDEGLNEAVTGLHESIVAAKEELQAIDPADGTDRIDIVYKLTNGRILRRTYNLPVGWLAGNACYRQVVESRAYKVSQFPVMDWESAAAMHVDAVSVMPSNDFDGGSFGKYSQTLTDRAQFEELLQTVQKDLEDLTMEGMAGDRPELLNVEFRIVKEPGTEAVPDPETLSEDNFYSGNYMYREVRLTEHFTRTIALLKEWGMYDLVVLKGEDVHHMEVDRYSGEPEGEYLPNGSMELSDPEQMQQVLDLGRNTSFETDYYEVSLYPRDNPEAACAWITIPESIAPEFIRSGVK